MTTVAGISGSLVYDGENRLSSAAGVSYETPGYDIWANLTKITTIKCAPPNLSVTVNANNRINSTGYAYDAAGNMTTVAGISGSLVYDAENRLSSAAGVSYVYDGDGTRVKKDQASGSTYDKLYWHGAGGEVLLETNLTGTLLDEYVYFNGQRVARRNSAGTVFYYLQDHLGTSRAIVQAGQTNACYEADYYPFGGERVITNTCPQNYKFTGQERDPESGLDFFIARYYASNLGRFLQTDPIRVTIARLHDPQRFNLYAYTRNSPLVFVDPEGQDVNLANKEKEERRQTLLRITVNMRAEEQRNIGVRKSADGKVELYVKDPTKINLAKASAGYRNLVDRINNKALEINVTLIPRGGSATGQDGAVYTQSALSQDLGGVTAYYGNGNIDIFVAEGGQQYGVMGLTASGMDVPIAFPDHIVMAHELFGETLKYTPGNEYLQTDAMADKQKVIAIDNEIRQFHGLPQRSGKDRRTTLRLKSA